MFVLLRCIRLGAVRQHRSFSDSTTVFLQPRRLGLPKTHRPARSRNAREPQFEQPDAAGPELSETRLTFAERVGPPSIRNQVLFVVFGSLLTFGVAARQTNLDTYYWTNRIVESGITWKFGGTPQNDELRRGRTKETVRELRAWMASLQRSISWLSRDLQAMALYTYAQAANSFVNSSEGKRMCYFITAANTAVWAMWQVPRLEAFMLRSFAHHPLSGLSFTMLTSIFSHSGILHLVFNSMALLSFGSVASLYLTRQQQSDPSYLRESTTAPHFLAFYITAGLFSSLVSHVASARIRYPLALARLRRTPSPAISVAAVTEGAAAVRATSTVTGAVASAELKPSLGASGAIYAAITLTAMAFPDTHISLIFPPTPPIPIQYGVFGFMAFDLLGVIRGWRVLDHYAHLGGAAFGLWYYAYGQRVWETFREAGLGELPRSLRKP